MPCPRTQQANLPACSPQPPINAERQAGSYRYHFLKSFGMTRLGANEPHVYRLRSGRSNHYAIASVEFLSLNPRLYISYFLSSLPLTPLSESFLLFFFDSCLLFVFFLTRSILKWNVGCVLARNVKLFYFVLHFPVDIVGRLSNNLASTHINLSEFLDTLLSDMIALTPGLSLFYLMADTLVAL